MGYRLEHLQISEELLEQEFTLDKKRYFSYVKYLFYFAIVCLGIILPALTYGASYQGSGFGYSGANVCFDDSGSSQGGIHYYWNSGHDYFLGVDASARYWIVTNDLMGSSDYYWDSGAPGGALVHTADTVPSWTPVSVSPGGSFVEVSDCSSPPPEATTTLSTARETTYGDWLFVNGIIIMLLFLILARLVFFNKYKK